MTTAPNLVVAGHPALSRKLRNTGRFPAVFDVASATELRNLSNSGMVPPPAAFMFAPDFNEDLPDAGVPRLADELAAGGFTVLVHGFFTERGDRFGPGVIATRKPLSLSDLLTTLGATSARQDLQPEPPPEPWTLPGTPPAEPVRDGAGDEHRPPEAPPEYGEPPIVPDKKPGIPSSDKLLVGRPRDWQPVSTVPKEQPRTAVPEEPPVNAVSDRLPVRAVPEEQPEAPVPDEQPVNTVPGRQLEVAVPEEPSVDAVPGQHLGDMAAGPRPWGPFADEQPGGAVPGAQPVNAVPQQSPGFAVPNEQLGGVGWEQAMAPGPAPVTSGRRLPLPAAVAVLVLAGAAAIGAGGLVFGDGASERGSQAAPAPPDPSPAESPATRSPQARPTQVPTSTPTALRPAKELVPGRVRIVDGKISIEVAWEDRSGGRAVYYVVGGPAGRPPSTLATAPRGTEKVTVAALNPSVNYCLTVVAVVDVDRVGQSEPVCTRRVEQEE